MGETWGKIAGDARLADGAPTLATDPQQHRGRERAAIIAATTRIGHLKARHRSRWLDPLCHVGSPLHMLFAVMKAGGHGNESPSQQDIFGETGG